MKKIILLMLLISVGSAFSDWNSVINQEEQQAENEKIKVLNENFKLEKFSSQEQFEKLLIEKMYDKIIANCSANMYYYGGIRPLYKTAMLNGKTVIPETTNNLNNIKPEKISYGKTNLQKTNVDEPEILKLTKNYIAYFDKKYAKIYIISSPVSGDKLDLNKVNISDTIKVPKLINKNTVKLFFIKDQLIAIGTRYSKAFNGQVTDLVFYKIINGKAKFNRIYDIKGNFKDARIVNNKIYVITDYNFSNIARQICQNYVINPLKIKVEAIRKKYQDQINQESKKQILNRDLEKIEKLRHQMNEEIKNLYDKQKENLNKQKILNELQKGLIQKSIDIYVNKNAKFKFKGKIYPITIRLINSALNNILFVPTNFDKLAIYNLKFNLVNIVDIDTKQNPNQYVVFGNMTNGQIHMTSKSLYLVNNYYESNPWSCPPGLLCILPIYPRGDFTLIHKFSISGFNLNYINSQIIPGRPINQYSMDEDNSGDFRIFTKYYYPERATDLYTFDKNLNLEGKIQGIAKGEDFKSSRFIGDKAYLVTFKATDPLFVIDLKDNKKPKIIGELKIPGYSLYLHPLDMKQMNSSDESGGNVQYLLGIGQEAEEVHGNRSLPKNIKLDIYKIDYSQKSGDKISVKQIHSIVLGNEKKAANGGSWTPVFNNPRTFVMFETRGNNQMKSDEKILLLPVYLAEDKLEKRCYPRYIWEKGRRIKNGDNCYNYSEKMPYFIGIKGFKVNLGSGFTEILSKNYINIYKNVVNSKKIFAYNGLNQWNYKNENHRVSYYTNGKDFIPFEINNNFFDMFKGSEDKFIPFNPSFKQIKEKSIDKNPSSKCFYKKPAPGTITCQMYCGKRWILENGKCTSIIVDAACSCPGFDTESQCKTNCEK